MEIDLNSQYDKKGFKRGEPVPMAGSFKITKIRTSTGEILQQQESGNLILNIGRDEVLKLLFGFSGSSPFISLAAGACSTAADVDDLGLNYEHILNATRKTLTNTSDAPLSASDIQTEEVVVSGTTYYRKVVARASYDGATDGNVYQPFQEFGLANTVTLPATPTSTSGVLLNHYVSLDPTILNPDTTIVVDTTIRV